MKLFRRLATFSVSAALILPFGTAVASTAAHAAQPSPISPVAQVGCTKQKVIPIGECGALGYLDGRMPFAQKTGFSFLHPCETPHLITCKKINGERHVINVFLNDRVLTGTIAPEVQNLTYLEQLTLGYNQLTGTIPTTIGSLTKLTFLQLSDNRLTGTIPASLGNLANLQYLYLDLNQLVGKIPTTIGMMNKLRQVNLSNNQLSGAIPSTIDGQLYYLKGLWLSNNQLSGKIPATLANLQGLTWLDLGNNRLSGQVPASITTLANLSDFWLSGNPEISMYDGVSFAGWNRTQLTWRSAHIW
jgi:Leucine-rich repeat (LRR) protein